MEEKKYTIFLNYAAKQLVYRVSTYRFEKSMRAIVFYDDFEKQEVIAPFEVVQITRRGAQ